MGLKVVQVSKELREFLLAYLYWAVSGSITGENPHNFERGCGLCSNTLSYKVSVDGNYDYQGVNYLKSNLSRLLENTGMDSQYPFGKDEYLEDIVKGTHHLNQRRLDWIKARLHEYPI